MPKVKLLLIEDNLGDYQSIVESLFKDKDTEYVIEHKMTLALAIEYLQINRPDLILLDLGLPDSNGIVTLESIFNFNNDLAVLVLTAIDDDAIGMQAIKMGALDYLIKRYANFNALPKMIKFSMERYNARKEILEMYSILTGTINSIPEMIFSVDNNYCYTSYNHQHAEVMKAIYFSEIKIGKSLFEFMTVKEDIKIAQKNIDRALQGEQFIEQSYSGDEEYSRRYFEISHNPIYDNNRRIIGVAVLAKDITHIKKTIDALKDSEITYKQLNEALEHLVSERTAQLKLSNKELEAFSYSVSHDLRTPLRAISGYSTIIKQDYGNKLDEQGLEYLSKICKGVQQMSDIMDSLLLLAKTHKAEVYNTKVNLSDLVKSITSNLKTDYPNRNIEFIIESNISVYGDSTLLSVALTNLLENALKFTATRTRTIIQFGKTTLNEQKVFYIKDNGIGFKMEHATKLFSAFQKLNPQADIPGTGIGLATVFKIIKKHGGDIWAESIVDKYTCFYFTIHGDIKEDI
jgi:PAS domain S-box-containing protein